MKAFRNAVILLVLPALVLVAAERLVVHRAQLAGPMGTDSGKLVLSGDQVMFVNDTNPDLSFSIPRADVRALRLEDGVLTFTMDRPFTDMYNSSPSAAIRFSDPNSPGVVASWMGLPLGRTALAGDADRFAGAAAADPVFDIKHDDDTGRLFVRPDGLDFQAEPHAKKSRRWSYNQIKEFKHDRDDYNFKMKTYDGESFDFRLLGGGMSPAVYNLIADRIIAARRNP
jgi:hypothetical protein